MKNETFVTLLKLLNISQREAAEKSGYSYATINSISGHRRSVSPELEQFIRGELRNAKDNEAVKVILEECKYLPTKKRSKITDDRYCQQK